MIEIENNNIKKIEVYLTPLFDLGNNRIIFLPTKVFSCVLPDNEGWEIVSSEQLPLIVLNNDILIDTTTNLFVEQTGENIFGVIDFILSRKLSDFGSPNDYAWVKIGEFIENILRINGKI